MIFEVTIEGVVRCLAVKRAEGSSYAILLDDRELLVDWLQVSPQALHLLVDGQGHDVGIERLASGYRVVTRDGVFDAEVTEGVAGAAVASRKHGSGPTTVRAPMPGKVVRVLAAEGQDVGAGAGLLVMEAMKMENEIRAPRQGTLKSLAVREGQAVETGAALCVIE